MKDAIGATIGASVPMIGGGWAMLEWRDNLYPDPVYNTLVNVIVNLYVIFILGLCALAFAFIGSYIQEQCQKYRQKWHNGQSRQSKAG